MKLPLRSLIFLRTSLVFPILLFFSIYLHWSLRKAFLYLLWNSALKWVYLSFSPSPFASLLFIGICKASSDNYFALLHFFFLGMVLMTASFTISQTSIHNSSGTLSDLICCICLSLLGTGAKKKKKEISKRTDWALQSVQKITPTWDICFIPLVFL